MTSSQTSRNGCLTLFFGTPWRLATRQFATQHLFTHDKDETMDRIYAARAIGGLIVITGVTLRYHGVKAAGAQANQWVDVTERTVLVIVLVLGVSVLLALAWTKPTFWWPQIRQFRWPILAVGSFFAACYGFMFITWVTDPKNHFHHRTELATVGSAFLYLAAVLWIVVFIPRAVYLVAGGWCRAADAHPFLAPLVSTLVTWYIAVRSLIQGVGADGTPQKVALAVVLGGPISVTVLSVLEVFRLRHHQGWPFREGPLANPAVIQPRRAAIGHHAGR